MSNIDEQKSCATYVCNKMSKVASKCLGVPAIADSQNQVTRAQKRCRSWDLDFLERSLAMRRKQSSKRLFIKCYFGQNRVANGGRQLSGTMHDVRALALEAWDAMTDEEDRAVWDQQRDIVNSQVERNMMEDKMSSKNAIRVFAVPADHAADTDRVGDSRCIAP